MAEIRGKSVKFEDGRAVFLAKLPDGYGIRFTNAEGVHTALALSFEAMDALLELVKADRGETPTVWKQVDDLFGTVFGKKP